MKKKATTKKRAPKSEPKPLSEFERPDGSFHLDDSHEETGFTHAKPVSLHPLSFDQALSRVLDSPVLPPRPKPARTKKR